MIRLRFPLVLPAFLAALALSATAPRAIADCQIDGPSHVPAGSPFELCARGKTHWMFVWTGPNLASSTGTCVEVTGLPAGTYEFTLRAKNPSVSSKVKPQICTHRVVVTEEDGGSLRCSIDGPAMVDEGQTFQLCGPDDAGTYAWSGPGVPADTSSRCVSIGPLTPGSYTYVLRRMLGANEATCTHAVTVRAVGGSLQCAIDGPDVVVAGHAFELCGPSDAGTWGWSGPGVPPGSSSHCVTISGLGAGTYNYTLRCTRDADEGSCERSVVVTPDGGSVGPSCPTPLRFWLEQCRSDADGPVGIGARTLASVAACVEERIESWPWSGDRASFRELVESASLVPRDLLRQELAVLYANLCARDLGARLPDGSPIGLVGSTSFACSPLDKGHVDDLVARAENLLAHCSNARTSAATCPTELMALTMCLGRVTRGPATCAIALPPTPRVVTASSELARARFAPNPFSATTRMIYALPRASRVEAGVYDLNGRRVRALVSAALPAGVHELRWDGADDAGARVRPGMYFLRGTVGSEKLGVRVVYVK